MLEHGLEPVGHSLGTATNPNALPEPDKMWCNGDILSPDDRPAP